MGSPAQEAWRAEVQAKLAIVTPQVRGLEDLSKASISSETQAKVQEALTTHAQLQAHLQSELASLSNLDGDGYPDIPKVEVIADVFAELEQQRIDALAAFGEFEPLPPASTLNIALGAAADKP